MKRINLKKIVGASAILLSMLVVFLIAWLYASTHQIMEGPHLFFEKEVLLELNIKSKGRNIHKEITKHSLTDNKKNRFKVSIPGKNKQFFFERITNHHIPPDKYDKPSKVLVISDVEGDFKYLESILKGNGVIDKNYTWKYGNGHLVIVGDVFDRGKHVTECLWLIYKLEKEAQINGGQVHFILGNHEIMILQGDHRYVSKKYKKITKSLNIEYKDLYGPDTEIGRWLRSKNTIEIIGRTLFVHGGISMDIINSNLSITEINNLVRENIDETKKDHYVNILMGSKGPLWYRKYIEQPVDDAEIENILSHYRIKEMVVGHTRVKEVSPLYNKKVFAIDVERHSNKYTALLIEDGNHYMVNSNDQKTKL